MIIELGTVKVETKGPTVGQISDLPFDANKQ
jgi:hypothetical protein